MGQIHIPITAYADGFDYIDIARGVEQRVKELGFTPKRKYPSSGGITIVVKELSNAMLKRIATGG